MIVTNKPINETSKLIRYREEDNVPIYNTPGIDKNTALHMLALECKSHREMEEFSSAYDEKMAPYMIQLKKQCVA